MLTPLCRPFTASDNAVAIRRVSAQGGGVPRLRRSRNWRGTVTIRAEIPWYENRHSPMPSINILSLTLFETKRIFAVR